MRALIVFAGLSVAMAQPPDPAYAPLARAYEALQARDYEAAISSFSKAIDAAPQRTAIRKDLAYTYLKVGENLLARDQFQKAMDADPADLQVAKEYAFLCYETGERQQARRIFDQVRKTGDAVAEQAFQNIDAPLAAGIARWSEAIAAGADNYSAHYELGKLAEERDELELAAAHYERAWRLRPERRATLVDLGRAWRALGRNDDATAALLAASRGGETRAAESARALLPARYPFVSEFRRALELDSDNADLRRDLAYLLLELEREDDAILEFRLLAARSPADLLSITQLGFLLYARGDKEAAQALFDQVLSSSDDELANRVRAVLRMPQVPPPESDQPPAVSAREMAERSLRAGFLKDALKYYEIAHQADPFDAHIMLKLGWTENMLHQDAEAVRWFDFARKSGDLRVAHEAERAWRNLRGADRFLQPSYWFYPLASSRWKDVFVYGQVKAEFRTRLPLRPYLSLRFIGDERRAVRANAGGLPPQQLSESSFIPGVGVRSPTWHGVTAWAEAGLAAGYLTHRLLSDYRAGVNATRRVGKAAGPEGGAVFAEFAWDAVFISRFGNDALAYHRSRAGYALRGAALQKEAYWNANLTFDTRRQDWANFWETGPGFRLYGGPIPKPAYLTFDLLRGGYLIRGRAAYTDFRIGFWYAGIF